MNIKRTSSYVGTVSYGPNGKQLIEDLRNFLHGTKFRVSLMARGPRKGVPGANQSFLPLPFAKSVDIYLRSRAQPFLNGGHWVFPKRISENAYKKMIREIRGMASSTLKF